VAALRPENIDNKRMLIKIENGKGGKQRYSLLSIRLLEELGRYYKTYQPQIYSSLHPIITEKTKYFLNFARKPALWPICHQKIISA
jgi:integrase